MVMSVLMLFIVVGILMYANYRISSIYKIPGYRVLYGVKNGILFQNIYGGYPFLIGTLLTSFIALIISCSFFLCYFHLFGRV